MNKEQILKFWEAIRSTTNIEKILDAYKNKTGYSGKRTLQRYIQVYNNLRDNIPLKIIAENTGWTLDTIEQLNGWWQEYWNSKAPAESGSYVEPPHQQQIRESAKTLLSQIDFPFIGDRLKAAMTESPREQPKRERFSGSALLEGLRRHLQTDGYAQVLQGIEDFDQADADNLAGCRRLLELVKTEIERKYNIKIPFIDNEGKGFTISFVHMVCADAIERAKGTNHYRGFSYRYDGLDLKFGAYIIYAGIPGEDLKPKEDLHSAMREDYSEKAQTKDIADQINHIGEIQEAISQNLERFTLLSRVPGTCLLCQSPDRKSQIV